MTSFNFDNNGHVSAIATAIAASVITSCFVTVRVVARACIKGVWDLSDWILLSSQVVFITLGAAVTCGALIGAIPPTAITAKDLSNLLKWWLASELLYTVCVVLLRASIGLLLVEICGHVYHGSLIAIYFVVFVNITFAIFIFFFSLFRCHPVSYFWTAILGASGQCIGDKVYKNAITVTATIGAATDLLLGSLPVFLFWNLKMDSKTKASVFILLSLGVVTGVISTVRVGIVREAGFDLSGSFFTGTSNVAVLSLVEPAIGICCAAATTFRPIFKSWDDQSKLDRIELSTMSSKGNGGMGNWYKKVNGPPSDPRGIFEG